MLIAPGLAIVILLVRLDAGPIALDWLKPRIEQALTPESGDIDVTAERVELRLNREQRSLELVGVDVRYQADAATGEQQPLLTVPEVELTLSVEALLQHGVIAASHIKARAPSLTVMRAEDGGVSLFSKRDERGSGNGHLSDFLRRFMTASKEDLRFSFIKSLQIDGGRIAYYDQGRSTALTAEAAALELTRHEDGLEGSFSADIPQLTGDRATVSLEGRSELQRERIAYRADISDLTPAGLRALWPFDLERLPKAFAGLHLPVNASIEGEFDFDGRPSPIALHLQTGAGVIDLPDFLAEPIEVDEADIEGELAADFKALSLIHI